MPFMKDIVVLGSTGSIGKQTLDVAAFQGYRVRAISACRSVRLAEEQIRRFHPVYCAMADEQAAKDLQTRVLDTDTKILSGNEGVCALPGLVECDAVVNAVVGRAGLLPTMATLEAGRRLALANKESLVCAGALVKRKALEKSCPVLPVDSEHSAVFQCLQCGKKEEVSRILLTASGGPFFGRTKEELSGVSAKDALAHPTWSMGAKITVDSATLMNKGFEVMEASYLFDVPADRIEVLVHRESVVHSMVEYCDSTVIAQLSLPDMRDCIQYALTYPHRVKGPMSRLDLTKIGKLTFGPPDTRTFHLLSLALWAMKEGGLAGAVLNGANEGAVALFLEGRISFLQISELVEKVTREYENRQEPSLEEICFAGEEAERRLWALI